MPSAPMSAAEIGRSPARRRSAPRIALALRNQHAARSARQAIEKNPRYPMAYAWLAVAECARGDTAEAQVQVRRLADIIPNFGPDVLAKLFEVFPPALRGEALGVLRAGGLVPGE